MAFFECNYYSGILARNIDFFVAIPEERPEKTIRNPEGKFRTLFVLHGGLEDCRAWIYKSSVTRYAEHYGLAVVAVSYENSYLTDLRVGQQYWTWMTQDMIPYVRSVFPLSEKREDNFVAGASMGGYCATKLALRKAELFAGLAIFSGAVDSGDELKGTPDPMNFRNPFFLDAFGSTEQYKGSENDVVALMRQFSEHPERLPKIYHCCGTEDRLYRDNVLYRDLAQSIGADVTWEELLGGHTWEIWDACIPHALEVLTSK